MVSDPGYWAGYKIISSLSGGCCWQTDGLISRDGRYVAYVASDCGPQVPTCDGFRTYVRDLKTGSWDLIQVPPLADSWNVQTIAPDLSGDGTLLAFETGPLLPWDSQGIGAGTGTNNEVWIYEVRGGLDP
jgi:Tol biopolymer transport system component